MVVYGVSQSSGVERRLEVGRSGPGVLLRISDHAGGVERDRLVVSAEGLMAAVVERPEGGTTVEGEAGSGRRVEVQVRGNEVQLRTWGDAGDGCDVAVGLDDFQDALEQAAGGE
jgi:hypothetical protein